MEARGLEGKQQYVTRVENRRLIYMRAVSNEFWSEVEIIVRGGKIERGTRRRYERATSGIGMAWTMSAETNGTNPKLSIREANM